MAITIKDSIYIGLMAHWLLKLTLTKVYYIGLTTADEWVRLRDNANKVPDGIKFDC